MGIRMRHAISMRRKGLPQLAGWLGLPAVLLVVGVCAWIGGHDILAQRYSLWPLSVNAALRLQDLGRLALVAVAAFALCVQLPLRAWGAHPPRWPFLAWLWSVGGVLPAWAYLGLQFNRYRIPELWRETTSVGPASLPLALTSPRVWGVNLGLSLGALILVWALARGWKLVLPRLACYRAPRWWRGLALVGALALVVLSVAPLDRLRPLPSGGDVILISLDAFRADRLEAYGGPPELAPNLNRFAEDATVFDRAYCQEPWTLTSHMSMLTSLYPDVHGLDFGRALPPEVWTLPELFREAGWRTYGSVYDCLFLEPRFGYGQGFDSYQVNRWRAGTRSRAMADRLLDHGPAFVFLHFYDPHSDRGPIPYLSESKWRQRFAPGAASAFEGWAGPGGASETLYLVSQGKWKLDAAQGQALRELYDAGIAETDAAVGSFLDALRAAGRYDEALIVVVADHGEALGEMGRERPHYMHEELLEVTLHIPLMIKYPASWSGVRKARSAELAETVDLLPTLCSVMGVAPADPVQGHPLPDGGPTPREFSFARSGEDYAITSQEGVRLHYRWSESGGVDFLDPQEGSAELRDRAVEAIARLHRANQILAQRLRGEAVGLTAADEELLRSLGYVQ